MHDCDNPPCVRDDHLKAGTQKQNIQDAKKRGRLAVGAAHGRSVLTPADVKQIRKSALNASQLARAFGVGRGTIRAILEGKTWTHV